MKQETNPCPSEEEIIENNEADVHNFSSVGRITRSRRVSVPSNVQNVVDDLTREKGK